MPVGSTRVVERALGRADVFVVSNPEFLREGSAVHDFLHPDRIVIGSDDQARGHPRRRRSTSASPRRCIVTDPASAETIKYASNAFLATKISFVNADRRGVRGGRRRRERRRARHGLRQAHRPRVPPPRPGLGRLCFPKDTRALVRIAEDAGYDFDLLEGVIAVNERAVRAGRRRRSSDAAGGSRRRRDRRRVGPHVQGPHRRPARLAVARDHPPAARRGARRSGPTTRRSTAPTRLDGIEVVRRPVRGLRGRRRARRAHRVGRVPLARLRQGRRADGAAARSSTPATCSTAAAVARRGFELRGHRAGVSLMAARRRHRRRRVPRLAPLRARCSTAATRSSAVDNLVTGAIANIEHLFGRARLHVRATTTSATYVWVPGHVDAVLHFASPASPIDYLDDADPDPEGRQPRHAQHARPGQGQGRPVLPRLHQRGLRRPAGAPAARGLLGQRQPDRPARRVRRGQALRRGDDDGVPPLPRPRRAHRAHLQHLRPADATRRRAGRVELHRAGARAASRSRSTATARQTRSFCYVDDEVRGLARAARRRATSGR